MVGWIEDGANKLGIDIEIIEMAVLIDVCTGQEEYQCENPNNGQPQVGARAENHP